MKGGKLLVTMKDMRRYEVLKDVIEMKLRGTEAAQILELTTVHISRLKKRLLNEGFEGGGSALHFPHYLTKTKK